MLAFAETPPIQCRECTYPLKTDHCSRTCITTHNWGKPYAYWKFILSHTLLKKVQFAVAHLYIVRSDRFVRHCGLKCLYQESRYVLSCPCCSNSQEISYERWCIFIHLKLIVLFSDNLIVASRSRYPMYPVWSAAIIEGCNFFGDFGTYILR